MPNGIDWKRIAGEEEHPIERMKPLLNNFSKVNNLRLYYTTYHDGLEVEFSGNYPSKQGKYYVSKKIRIDLEENLQNKLLLCRIGIFVNIHYGFKELIFLIPFLRNIRKKWQRKSWSQKVGYLTFPIDLQKLQDLLNQAKQILDNFDEKQFINT